MANTTKDPAALETAGALPNKANAPWCDDYEKMISGML
jgi:hypothetical protein